jgi:hypothetical protein
VILGPAEYDRVARHLLAGYLAYHDERLRASTRGVKPHRSGSVSRAWDRVLADCATTAAFLGTTPFRIRTEVEAAALASRDLARTTEQMSARLERRPEWIETAYVDLAKRLEGLEP